MIMSIISRTKSRIAPKDLIFFAKAPPSSRRAGQVGLAWQLNVLDGRTTCGMFLSLFPFAMVELTGTPDHAS